LPHACSNVAAGAARGSQTSGEPRRLSIYTVKRLQTSSISQRNYPIQAGRRLMCRSVRTYVPEFHAMAALIDVCWSWSSR
jgi:hypothetical protein